MTGRARRWRGPLAAALAAAIVAVLLRALLPAALAGNESSDFHLFYEPAARSVLAGEGLSIGGLPLERFPPLFPLLVAGVLGLAALTPLTEAAALAAFSIGCFALAAAVLYALADSLWGRRGAIAVAAVWGTYPPLLWLTKQPNSELPFLVWLYLAVALLWALLRTERPRPGLALACGAVAGLAGLTRSIALALGAVLAAAWWALAARPGAVEEGAEAPPERPRRRRSRLLLAAAILAGNAVVLAPWSLWLTATTGRALGTGALHSMEDGLTFGVRSKGYRQGTWVPAGARRAMDSLAEGLAEAESTGEAVALVAERLARDPVGVSELYALKAVRVFYGTDSQRFELPLLVLDALWLALLGWAAARALAAGGELAAWARLSLFLLGYFWLASLIGAPLLRYLVPAIGLVFTLLPALGSGTSRRSARALR